MLLAYFLVFLTFNKKILDFKKNNPYLIHWVNECYEPKYKREPSVVIVNIYIKNRATIFPSISKKEAFAGL